MDPGLGQPGPPRQRPWLRRLLAAAWILIFTAYVVLVAVATGTGHAGPAAALLMTMLVLGAAQALWERNRTAAVLAVINLALVAVMIHYRGPFAALSLTTAILQAVFGYVFLRSLLRGRVDLVTRIACAIRAERSERELAYTRAVAWSWGALFSGMSAVTFVTGFLPPDAFWWWWMNVAPFAVPAAFFCLEWTWRQFWLRRELRAAGPIDWKRVRNIDFRHLFQP